MFDTIKKALFPKPVIVINTTEDTANLPLGFFIVEAASSGLKSLGYKNPQTKDYKYDVGQTAVVVQDGQRVTLDINSDLPLVRLAFPHHEPGVVRAGGRRFIDTDSLGWDGEARWDGGKPNDGWV